MPTIWQEHFAEMRKGMEIEFDLLQSFSVVSSFTSISVSDTDAANLEHLREFLNQDLDAVIYCPSLHRVGEELFGKLASDNVALFIVGSGVKDMESVCTIQVNSQLAGYIAADYLSRILHKGSQIAVFTGTKDFNVHQEKVEAFCKRIGELGHYPIVEIYETRDDSNTATLQCRELFMRYPEIKGIFISTATSTPICKYIEDNQLNGQVSVIGTDVFDDLQKYMKKNVMSATIYQNQVLQGRIAVNKAYEYLVKKNSYLAEEWTMCRYILVNPHLFMNSNLEAHVWEKGEDYICML